MQGSPPPLLRWQPADLRGWLFGVALCTRRRRPHCVKEKRREAILVLSPQSIGGPPHENRGPPWVRLERPETHLLFSLQTETSAENLKGNGSTESKMAKQGHWVTCKNGGQTKTEAMDGHWENSDSIKFPLYLLHSLSSSVAEQATTTLALCLLRGSHCTTTNCCSKMYKYVQRCTKLFMNSKT